MRQRLDLVWWRVRRAIFLRFGADLANSEGHYGLFLDDILQDGSSARCPTFENEPLCEVTTHTKSVPFECVGVEVWGVGI
jgi:hypothetical protein